MPTILPQNPASPGTAQNGPLRPSGWLRAWDSTTLPRPMRWARPGATIVAMLPILGAWSHISTLGCALGGSSPWWRARSRIAPRPTVGRPPSGPPRRIAWYLPANTARPPDRARAARPAGRPWPARSRRPSAPSRQPCAPPSMLPSPPSVSDESAWRCCFSLDGVRCRAGGSQDFPGASQCGAWRRQYARRPSVPRSGYRSICRP